MADDNYDQAHAEALKSFKEHFPNLSDEHAEKLMDAYILMKQREAARESAERN